MMDLPLDAAAGMPDLPPILAQLQGQLYTMLLALPRMLAMLWLLPFASRNLLPGLLRTGLAAALCLPLLPLLAPEASQSMALPLLALLLLKEVLIGFLLGMAAALPFWFLEGAGVLIDNQRGATIAGSLNPLNGEESGPLADLMQKGFIVFFFSIGGLALLLEVLYDSYRAWPPTAWWPRFGPATVDWALGLADSLMRLALLAAAPVLLAMFLAEAGLALISRFAPQLQVFFIAMPIKSALAMLMLAVYIGTLLYSGADQLADFAGAAALLMGSVQ